VSGFTIQIQLKKILACLSCLLFIQVESRSQGVLNDLDAQEYIYRGNIIDPAEKTAIAKLFRALKYYGIWDHIQALYLPTGGTELSHSLNAKNPLLTEDAFPLVFPNGATHTSSGVDWNGTDQGAMSFYRATSTRLHLMVYQSAPSSSAYIWSGDRNGITDFSSYTWSSLFTYGIIGFANTSGFDLTPVSDRTGFFYGQRTSHDSTEGYVNGVRQAVWANKIAPSNTDTSQFIWLNKSSQQAQFTGTAGYRMVSIGSAMDSARVNTYYEIIQAFLSELGIQNGEALDWPDVPSTYETEAGSNYQWNKATENVTDTARDGIHLYSIGDSLYLWGGWNGNWFPFSYNTGYVSGDGGTNWQKIGKAPWNIRHSAAYGTDSRGNGYLIGSDKMPSATDANRKEVWRTSNGRDWRLRTGIAPWSGKLILEGLAIKGNTLYIAGGQFGTRVTDGLNDTIWKSTNGGITWTTVNTHANNLGGILYNNFKYFVSRGKFVAFCGGKYDDDPSKRVYASQVWTSDDCITWTREADVPFEARQYSDMVEWDGKLWLFGGDRPASTGNGSLNLRDLWYMDKNGNWFEQGSTPLPPRHASGLTVDKKNNRLLIVCGNLHTDAWYLEKKSTGPEFTGPLTKNVSLASNCSFVMPDLTVDIEVEDSSGLVEFIQDPEAGTIISSFNDELIPVTITGIDTLGNERTQLVTLQARDTTPPVFDLADTMTINLVGDCQMIVPDMIRSISGRDNCGVVSFTQQPAAGALVSSGHNSLLPLTITANDGHGNNTVHTIILKGKDVTSPSFVLPADRNTDLLDGCQVIVPDLITGLTGNDACGTVSFTQSPVAGTLLSSSHNIIHTVVITASDNNGNFLNGTVSVTAKDLTIPVFEPVSDLLTEADSGRCDAIVALRPPVASDNCAVTLSGIRSDNKTLTEPFSVGETIMNWKAKDAAGNEATMQQRIMVTDHQPPVLDLISELKYCNRPDRQYNITPLGARDNCGIESIRYSITGATSRSGNDNNASGIFNSGTSIIDWVVKDIHGNIGTGQTSVVIYEPLDLHLPDVYAVPAGALANTLYKGYGPDSLHLTADVSGGRAPYHFNWSTGSSDPFIAVGATVNGSQTYQLLVTDATGCEVSATKEIRLLDVRCGTGNVLVCKKEGDQISSACVAPQEVLPLLNKGGNYLGNCQSSIATDASQLLTVSVLPNPSSSYFTLVVQSSNREPVTIRIFDDLGRLVDNRQTASVYTEFFIGRNYRPGIYLAELTKGKQKKTVKLVKTGN
jgi:hypothetical protein